MTRPEMVIRVEGLGKKFKIPHEKRNSVFESIANALQIFEAERFSYEEFWALKDVTFSVRKGESLGVIGSNGSGKSTLLKVLARIIRPTTGSVEVNGKSAPILGLGVGFHPDLTAKDNIRMYGSVMGLGREEVRNKVQPILEFAGLEKFGDAKLRNLSSGMQLRLAFAVAVETRPDLFFVDEALAVGDLDFQAKCIDKFREFREEGRTLVLVTQSMDQVKTFCDQAIHLAHGQVVKVGSPDVVTNDYLSSRNN